MTPRRATQRRLAAAIAELGLPVPFDLAELGARLQRGRARRVHLVPFTIAPDLFGAWIRTAAADYLYYEQQTSPLHQAHIALRLAACVLLGPDDRERPGPGALPAMGPELAELILGPSARNPVTRLDTETFAFLALEHSRGGPGSRSAHGAGSGISGRCTPRSAKPPPTPRPAPTAAAGRGQGCGCTGGSSRSAPRNSPCARIRIRWCRWPPTPPPGRPG